MRAFKKYMNRGFTLIELMIVVAIVGVLAALAIYGVRRYLLNAKTAEVRNALGQLTKDAKAAYERESMAPTIIAQGSSTAVANQLCATANYVPATKDLIQGKKYQSAVSDWMTGTPDPAVGWACLRFTISDPQYFMYYYTANTTADFTAFGHGDLNGDAATSQFVMRGAIQTDKSVSISPNFEETNPEE